MRLSAYIPVYSVTLLLSAALLFSVQPMFSKMVLPLLGGTPQVWNTAMLFFQIMLLGGYAYAHGTSKLLSVRAQAVLHGVLLLVFLCVLPIAIPPGWHPPTDTDPTLWQLSLMLMTVGGPFFILAGSAPMLQRWFGASRHDDSDNPYFLYGASNLGSMGALLAYPIVLEPLLTLHQQSLVWMAGYIVLVVFTFCSAMLVWKHAPKALRAPVHHIDSVDPSPVTWPQRFRWLVLAFIPSSLMLGVTTYITMDVASVPMLWVLPLAAYVGTFIIVFARKPLIHSRASASIQAILLIMLIAQRISFPNMDINLLIGLYILLFFFSALTCHSELAQSRPSTRHLTEFYLVMSLGGALGGFFNAIIAPIMLVVPIEFTFALVAACMMRFGSAEGAGMKASFLSARNAFRQKGLKVFKNPHVFLPFVVAGFALLTFTQTSQNAMFASIAVMSLGLSYVMDRRWIFTTLIAFILILFPLGYNWNAGTYKELVHQERNFYGILKISDTDTGERILLNGTTYHGTQALDPKLKLIPLSYYSNSSPLHDVFGIIDGQASPQVVGVLGLGVGAIACYAHEGRSFDYYEINPVVKEIAENPDYFTFLSDCNSPYRIIMGDGRLTLQKEPDAQYDMMVIDAFSSDNIPLHLMTTEALELYMRKIKQDGVLVIHISNRYLDLEPVLREASVAMKIPAIAKTAERQVVPGTTIKSFGSHWVVFSKNEQTLGALRAAGWSDVRARDGVKLWTDEYSNIFRVIGNSIGIERAKEDLAKSKAAQEKGAATE